MSLPDPGVDLCFDAYTQRLHVMSTANLQMKSDNTSTSNRMKSEHLVANIGFDTAEDEPCEVCSVSVYRSCRCIHLGSTGRSQAPFLRDEMIVYGSLLDS